MMKPDCWDEMFAALESDISRKIREYRERREIARQLREKYGLVSPSDGPWPSPEPKTLHAPDGKHWQ